MVELKRTGLRRMLVRLSPLCVKQLKLLRPPDAKQNWGPAERVRFWEEERRSKRETAILKRIVVANDTKSATTMVGAGGFEPP